MTDTVRSAEDLQKEFDWETTMTTRGMTRYLEAQATARAEGRGDEASAEHLMLKHYVLAVADGISAFTEVTQYSHDTSEKRLLRAMDSKAVAMIAMRILLAELHNPRVPLASAAQAVGQRIENELLMERFHSEHTAYFEEISRRIDAKRSVSTEYRVKSIRGSFRNQQEVEYEGWTHTQRCKIGQRLIQIVVDNCDLFYIHKVASQSRGGTFVRPTDACLEWIAKHDEEMSMIFPDRMPMLIPPDPWTSAEDGGYMLPHLRKMTPLIIKSPISTAHGRRWLAMYNSADMPQVYRAVNALQNTAWRVNAAVLRAVQAVMAANLRVGVPQSQPYEFPPCPLPKETKPAELDPDSELANEFLTWKSEMRAIHELESERRAKIVNTSRIVRMAAEMSDKDFWFVYRMDFRGRVYCATSGLSPQGTELAKALLRFRDGKVLGKDGWFWFRVSGANRYGKDKISFEDRVKWIDEQSDAWRACATDPIGNRSVWGEADEPYQFLAWCIEYNNAHNAIGGPETFKSYIPIGMDGSCNGLQHFSAMLRDDVGGRAVNLTPSNKPSDIYQNVADVMTSKLRMLAPTDPAAANWLALFNHMGLQGAPRKLTKNPVMTLPYGSTERTCCDSIMQWYTENGDNFFPKATAFKHALYLSPILWSSIGDVVIAARAAMAWIRKTAGVVARSGHPLLYKSVLGFPVKQQNEKTKTEIITTYLSGRLRVAIDVPTGELDSIRMQNGSAPNFVHHIDVTHMFMTVNGMLDAGITHFAMIHDDYGCHAADIAAMHRIIREQFVQLYHNNDLLENFRVQLEQNAGVKLPPPPSAGSLRIQDVIDSPYFFS